MDYPQITHVSLCAGYGGLDLGLKRACGSSLRTIAYSEIEACAIECLLARMEEGAIDEAPIWSDLKTFPWHELPADIGIMSAGYPCQPFSQAGLRAGKSDPRHLWPHVLHGITTVRPAVVFLENVAGHLSLGAETVLRDLQETGYRSTFGLFSAAEVGACHERKRLFILAHSLCERGQLQVERIISAVKNAGSTSQAGRNPDHWADYSRWSVEPCVRRDDDGAAFRVDRLRLLGNGVVPATAELAFRTLCDMTCQVFADSFTR